MTPGAPMRVFVAGATGAIGRQLVPMLVGRGHAVVGMTRRRDRAALLEEVGATACLCDVYDRPALEEAVKSARPDLVVHQLTALPGVRGAQPGHQPDRPTASAARAPAISSPPRKRRTAGA